MELQQAARVFMKFRSDVRQWLERNTKYEGTDWEILLDAFTFQLVLGIKGENFHFKQLALADVSKHYGRDSWHVYMQNYVAEGLTVIDRVNRVREDRFTQFANTHKLRGATEP